MTILRNGTLVALLILSFTPTGLSDDRAGTGVVKVVSEPDGATVRVDGKTFGPTPVLIELPVGKHEILVTRDGHLKATSSVQIIKDKLVHALVKLGTSVAEGVRVHRTNEGEPDAGPATITIATSPPGLTVLMSDLLVPQPTPVAFDIKAGIYELILEDDGREVYHKTVFARAGRTLELDLVVKSKRAIDDSDPWGD